MADDRHEAYRMIFTTLNVQWLFDQFRDEHSPADLTHHLMLTQAEHRDLLPNAVVDMVYAKLIDEQRN